MTETNEQTTNKLVDILIQVLHGQLSDSRHLALVQLVVLGDKAVQPLRAYLEKEEALQNDLEALGKPPGRLANKKDAEKYRFADEKFAEKWGASAGYYSEEEYIPRGLAIKGALEALSLLGQKDLETAFPKVAASVYFPNKPATS